MLWAVTCLLQDLVDELMVELAPQMELLPEPVLPEETNESIDLEDMELFFDLNAGEGLYYYLLFSFQWNINSFKIYQICQTLA